MQYFVKMTDNEWHLRATLHDERIVEMVCVEQKYVFAMMDDGTVKRLADDDSFQFNEIGFRIRSGTVLNLFSMLGNNAFFFLTFSGKPSKWLNCIRTSIIWL